MVELSLRGIAKRQTSVLSHTRAHAPRMLTHMQMENINRIGCAQEGVKMGLNSRQTGDGFGEALHQRGFGSSVGDVFLGAEQEKDI